VATGTATGRLPARPGANATPARRWLDEPDKTSRFIERFLEQFDRGITTPLVRVPDEPVVFAFNLIRSAPHDAARIGQMLEQNRALYNRIRAAGGRLYPASAIRLTADDWAEHFGPMWPVVRRAKERFDPEHILTPGYQLSVVIPR
jgi:cytokinin dehydrogenase